MTGSRFNIGSCFFISYFFGCYFITYFLITSFLGSLSTALMTFLESISKALTNLYCFTEAGFY